MGKAASYPLGRIGPAPLSLGISVSFVEWRLRKNMKVNCLAENLTYSELSIIFSTILRKGTISPPILQIMKLRWQSSQVTENRITPDLADSEVHFHNH